MKDLPFSPILMGKDEGWIGCCCCMMADDNVPG